MKRLNSLVIMEMQINTTVSYHFTPTRMTITKQQQKTSQNNKCWCGMNTLEPSYPADGKVKWYSHCGKSLVVPQEVKHRITI